MDLVEPFSPLSVALPIEGKGLVLAGAIYGRDELIMLAGVPSLNGPRERWEEFMVFK